MNTNTLPLDLRQKIGLVQSVINFIGMHPDADARMNAFDLIGAHLAKHMEETAPEADLVRAVQANRSKR